MKRLLIKFIVCLLLVNSCFTVTFRADDEGTNVDNNQQVEQIPEQEELPVEDNEPLVTPEEEPTSQTEENPVEPTEPTVEPQNEKIFEETKNPELLKSPQLGNPPEGSTDFVISQAEDGAIIITVNDANFFNSINENSYLNIIYYSDETSTTQLTSMSIRNYENYNYSNYSNFSTNQGFRVVEGDSGVEYIEISKETCLAQNIGNGFIEVSYYNYSQPTYNQMTSNRCEVSGLAEECTTEVTVSEDTVNKRIVIESDDKEFLQALTEPRINYSIGETGEYVDYRGSEINFFSSQTSNNYISNNKWSDNSLEEFIFYDYDNKLIYIPKEIILHHHILNGNYTLKLSAYGYTTKETNEFTISEIGCKQSPNYNDITVYQDATSGDLIIDSSDKDWLRALEKKRIYLPETWVTTEYGSSVNFSYGNTSFYFNNQKCTASTSDNEIDYYYDEQEEYICIPFASLMSQYMTVGELSSAFFEVYGYNRMTVTFNPTVQITQGCVNCSNYNISIVEDDDGNVVVHSSNLDYLRALVKIRENDKYYAHIEVQYNSNSWNWFSNYSSSSIELVLDEDEMTVTIPHDKLLNRNIGNGLRNIKLCAYGYNKYQEDVQLSHACESAPTGVLTNIDTNGNLTITSADTDWISALSIDGCVGFYTNNNWAGDIYSDEYNGEPFPISNNGQTVIVSVDRFISSYIPSGSYTLRIEVNGYEQLILSQIIKIKGCKIIEPKDIRIDYDFSAETIKISSNIKDFIEKLYSYTSYYYYDNKPSKNIRGGSIYFSNPNCNGEFYNYKTYHNNKTDYDNNVMKLSSDHKTITILKKAIYDNSLAEGYDYEVCLRAPGYVKVIKNITDLKVGVESNLPNIDVTFEENVGITITADDETWLDGIINNSSSYVNVIDTGIYERGNWFSVEYFDDQVFVKENNKIIIPMEYIYRNSLSTGDYKIWVSSYGYRKYIMPDTLSIVGLQDAPSDITFIQGEERFIINSNNKDYLQKLAFSGWDSGVEFFKDGARDYSQDYAFLSNYWQNYVFYDDVNEYAYIDFRKWRDILDGLEISLETDPIAYLTLCSLGYENLNIDYQCKLIDREDDDPVVGATEQLSFAGFDEEDVEWFSQNPNIAEIDDDGLITGKAVGTSVITAKYTDEDEKETYDKILVQIKSNTKVSLKLKTEDNNAIAMVGEDEQLLLSATNYTLNDSDEVNYSSTNENIATIDDDGLVHFLKPGNVTIIVNAINKKATLKLTVYNVDKSKKVSLSCSSQFLEKGQEVEDLLIFKAGDDEVPDSVDLIYTSSNTSIIAVDEDGKLTAGDKNGTAKITVAIDGDPSKRKATISLQVVDTMVRSIDESLNIDNPDSNIIKSNSLVSLGSDNVRVILVDFADIDKDTKFHINTIDCGKDRNGNSITPSKVSYVSTDSSIASVDKNGYVQFKKAGQVTITVTVASNPKGYDVVSRDIIFKAVDYAPRIETNKFSINKYYATNPTYNVYKIMNTDIVGCSLTELNGDTSSLFKASYSEVTNKITIQFKEGVDSNSVAAKSYSQLLQFEVDGDGDGFADSSYKYKVSVIVAQTLPSVTPKVTGFYNTFTKENTLELVTTVKDATLDTTTDNNHIDGIEFVDDWADYEYDDGTVTITPNYVNGKPILSGTVRFRFAGYTENGYVDKTIKLPSKNTKPTVKLINSTITIYTPNDVLPQDDISVVLVDKVGDIYRNEEATISVGNGSLDCTIDKDEFYTSNGQLNIHLNEVKNGKVLIQYKEPNWSEPITNILNIKTNRNLPTAKLSSGTINVNTAFEVSEPILISLPGSSETISDVVFEGDDGINITYNGGQIAVDPTTATLGTYKIKATPKIGDNKELKQVSFTVKVVDTKPTLKFKSTTIKLNQLYSESINAPYTITNNPYNASVVGVKVEDTSTAKDYVNVSMVNGNISLSLENEGKTAPAGNYTLFIKPKYGDGIFGSAVKVTVNLYSKTAASSTTVKEAFNPFNSNAASTVTVKLTNLTGEVKTDTIGIEFANGETLASGLFEFDYDGTNFILKAKDDADWSDVKNQTLKANVIITTTTGDVVPSTISIKIDRKAPSVKLASPTVNVYDTTVDAGTKVAETAIEIPEGFAIDTENTELPPSLAYTLEFGNNGKSFIVKMKDGSKLKAGSTSSFNIKLIWQNDYYNSGKFTKALTIKLNVKDMSGSIKASQ